MSDRIVVRDNPQTAYEPSDWPLGAIGLVFLAIFVLLVVAPLVLMAAFPESLSDIDRKLATVPPPPRLQVSPAADLARRRAAEQRLLDTYYWIDRERGIVHIPIEEAMKKLAEDGIDGFPKAGR